MDWMKEVSEELNCSETVEAVPKEDSLFVAVLGRVVVYRLVECYTVGEFL